MILIKKIFFVAIFNCTLFSLLMIGIQNSSKSKKVNLLISDTVKLPNSFIIGVSFISGSILGSLLTMDLKNKREKP